MSENLNRVKILSDFIKLSEAGKFNVIQHFKKFPKLYNDAETWVIKSHMVREESLGQIDSWLDELHESGNAISLPHIPYDYHHLYAELVRREREEL